MSAPVQKESGAGVAGDTVEGCRVALQYGDLRMAPDY